MSLTKKCQFFYAEKEKPSKYIRPQFQNRVYCYRRCVLSPSVLYFIAILSCRRFISINFITGCLIRYTCLNSRLTVFVSCLQRLLVVSRLRLRTLAWRSLAIIRRLLIHSRASHQFIACEIFYEYPMVWYCLNFSLLRVRFCQKVLMLLSYLQRDERFMYFPVCTVRAPF